MKTSVTFKSAGLKIAGDLYTPRRWRQGSPAGDCGRQPRQ
jgi:hypothetical protein